MSKIKVYIESQEIEYELSGQLAVQEHPCYGFKKEIVIQLPEDHERAERIAEEVAEEQGLDVEIHDLSESFSSTISAFFKRVKTPAIEIGHGRENGAPSKEKLLSLLNQRETLRA